MYLTKSQSGADKMAEEVNVPDAKPVFNPPDSYNLSSDPHVCTVVHVPTHRVHSYQISVMKQVK